MEPGKDAKDALKDVEDVDVSEDERREPTQEDDRGSHDLEGLGRSEGGKGLEKGPGISDGSVRHKSRTDKARSD